MVSADQSRSVRPQAALLRELYFNRNGLLLLLSVAVAAVMLVVAARTHGTASAFWFALGTALLASAIFSALTVLLTATHLNHLIAESIRISVSDSVGQEFAKMAARTKDETRLYIPSRSYPATDIPDPLFNSDLIGALDRSDRYLFQGVTARYAVARLAALPTTFDTVRIVIADPTKPESVITRAQRDFDLNGRKSDLDQARKKLLHGIWMSVVGAYIARRRADKIEFCFVTDPPIDRAEILDNDIFLSRFSDPDAWKSNFPASMRFNSESLLYQIHTKDAARLFSSPYTLKFTVPADDDHQIFLRQLGQAGLTLDESEYLTLKGEFEGFCKTLPAAIAGNSR